MKNFNNMKKWKIWKIDEQDLGLKCQTPLRLKAWVKEVEGLFYSNLIFEPKNWTTIFWTKHYLKIFYLEKIFLWQNFWTKIFFRPEIFFRPKLSLLLTKDYFLTISFFQTKIFLNQNLDLDQISFGPKFIFGSTIFWTKKLF